MITHYYRVITIIKPAVSNLFHLNLEELVNDQFQHLLIKLEIIIYSIQPMDLILRDEQ